MLVVIAQARGGPEPVRSIYRGWFTGVLPLMTASGKVLISMLEDTMRGDF